MPVPEYDGSLGDAISKASQRADLATEQQAQLAAAERSKAQARANTAATASRFNSTHVAKLLTETATTCFVHGYRFHVEPISEDHSYGGTVGQRLATNSTADVVATINYSDERFVLRVLARLDEYQWPLYHNSTELSTVQFSDSVALRWFQSHVPAAVAALIEQGVVSKSPHRSP